MKTWGPHKSPMIVPIPFGVAPGPLKGKLSRDTTVLLTHAKREAAALRRGRDRAVLTVDDALDRARQWDDIVAQIEGTSAQLARGN